jgi:hypothetical protein
MSTIPTHKLRMKNELTQMGCGVPGAASSAAKVTQKTGVDAHGKIYDEATHSWWPWMKWIRSIDEAADRVLRRGERRKRRNA